MALKAKLDDAEAENREYKVLEGIKKTQLVRGLKGSRKKSSSIKDVPKKSLPNGSIKRSY